MFASIRKRLRRRKFAAGARLSRFVAPDVEREVEIVDASEVDNGIIVARIRTWNLLHVARGLSQLPAFSEPRRVAIERLWEWRGAIWGGPVPKDDPSFD